MAALASIALASCTGDYDDWASPSLIPGRTPRPLTA